MGTPAFVMFDADGSLVDTMGYHRMLAAGCILKYFGSKRLTFDEALASYDSTSGVSFPEQLSSIFPGDAYSEKRHLCAGEYNARKADDVYSYAKVFPDVPEGVMAVRKICAGTSVSTSTERDIISAVLLREGAGGYFDVFHGMDDGSKPMHIEKIRLSYNPKTLFFVGDSPTDMRLKEHGVVTIGRTGNAPGTHPREELMENGASFVTDDFRELAGFLSGVL